MPLSPFPGALIPYQREAAVAYAIQWALGHNPRYLDFSTFGGDCTNFASQTLYAGGCRMNYDAALGWYYQDGNRKSPSWTGVNFLYQFLTTHNGPGPVAVPTDWNGLELGDLVQLSFSREGPFHHTPVVTQLEPSRGFDGIYVCAHTDDQLNANLVRTYNWERIRFLHILGSR